MARRDRPADDGAELRAFLLADAVEFRELYGHLSPECWSELSKAVDLLAGGEAYRLQGWMLPDGHPARADYGRNADLLLDESDRLTRYEDYLDVSRPQHPTPPRKKVLGAANSVRDAAGSAASRPQRL